MTEHLYAAYVQAAAREANNSMLIAGVNGVLRFLDDCIASVKAGAYYEPARRKDFANLFAQTMIAIEGRPELQEHKIKLYGTMLRLIDEFHLKK